MFDTKGSLDGDLQIQAIDELRLLEYDNEAWGIVNKGTEPHHIKVK